MRFADRSGYTQNIRPGFIKDLLTREHVLAGGIKLDPTTFTGADDTLVTLTSVANKAAVSLAVEALATAIPAGEVLNFGARTVVPVTISATCAAGATALSVSSLVGPIPDNTILDFGGAKFARLAAAVAALDTTIPVDAIPTQLVADDEAAYEAEVTLEATVSTAAVAGDEVLLVAALDDGIADGAVARYVPPAVGKRIPAGTPVYCLQTDLESGANTGVQWKYAGGGVTVTANDCVRLLAYDVQDVDANNDGNILRKGTAIGVNHMYWDTLSASVKAAIRADYEVTVDAPGQEVAHT